MIITSSDIQAAITRQTFSTLSLTELKTACLRKGLSDVGLKSELLNRLVHHATQSAKDESDAEVNWVAGHECDSEDLVGTSRRNYVARDCDER